MYENLSVKHRIYLCILEERLCLPPWWSEEMLMRRGIWWCFQAEGQKPLLDDLVTFRSGMVTCARRSVRCDADRTLLTGLCRCGSGRAGDGLCSASAEAKGEGPDLPMLCVCNAQLPKLSRCQVFSSPSPSFLFDCETFWTSSPHPCLQRHPRRWTHWPGNGLFSLPSGVGSSLLQKVSTFAKFKRKPLCTVAERRAALHTCRGSSAGFYPPNAQGDLPFLQSFG